MKRLLWAVSLIGVYLAVLPGPVAAQAPGARDARADARALAEKIDKLIEASWAGTGLKAAPLASDTQYLRRLHIDLSGRIPSLLDIRDFLDNDDPKKREERIEKLLADESYSRHFAAIWRSIMLQGTTNNNQFGNFQPQFEQWLRGKLQTNTGYDKVVRELITVQGNPGMMGGGGGGGSPVGFFFANENKPENLAGATSRVFLGVKLECAQCHKHPFAKWTRNQFWEYAAFFAGVQPLGGRRGGVVAAPGSRQIRIPETDKVVKAKFITGTEPQWKDGVPSTQVLADWLTAADNPYFSKAAVDHVWSYFFGSSLMEAIMEPSDEMPTHPDLLALLAKEFAAHDFDLKFLIRTIVQTKAYQRVSGTINAHRDEVLLFARMPVRGLSPEQFFDSLSEATDYTDPYASQPQFQQMQFNGGPTVPRLEFLNKFTSQDKRTEAQTSILQALFMMNGKFLTERTKLENNKSLYTIATAPTSTARRVETLYLLVLSRMPTEAESARMVRYIEAGGPTRDSRQAVADVYWALLNSGEFLLNH